MFFAAILNTGHGFAADTRDSTHPVLHESSAGHVSTETQTASDSASLMHKTVDGLRARLDSLSRRMDALRSKMETGVDEAGKKAKGESQRQMQALEKKRDHLKGEMDELEKKIGRAAGHGWNELVDRTGHGLDSLKAKLDRLKKKVD